MEITRIHKSNVKVNFLSISEFKKSIGGGVFKIVYNDDTEKYAVLDEFGSFYCCQQDINPSLPMGFLIEEGKSINYACLVNLPDNSNLPPLFLEIL
jgi:hypothetical protein